jgi:hypothetical protein
VEYITKESQNDEIKHKHEIQEQNRAGKIEKLFALFFCTFVASRGMWTSKTRNHAKPEDKRKVYDPAFVPYLKKRPSTAPPRLLASPLAEKAPVAIFVAWLNLSQREKARVFVTARTIAITSTPTLAKHSFSTLSISSKHTNQTQPNKMQSENGNNTQSHPTDRLRIQCQPEKSLVRSVYLSSLWVCGFKDPVSIS